MWTSFWDESQVQVREEPIQVPVLVLLRNVLGELGKVSGPLPF